MYQRILIPIDGSPTSERGLDEAIRLGRLTGARVRLIHVVDELSFALGASEGVITAETAFAYYPSLKLNAGIPYGVTYDYALPTKLSAGLVLAASVTYPNIFGTRASLSPDIAISQGVKGISATALPGFIQGAGAAVIGATIDFKTNPGTKMRVDYTRNWGGGDSNLMRDRDFLSVSFTTSF